MEEAKTESYMARVEDKESVCSKSYTFRHFQLRWQREVSKNDPPRGAQAPDVNTGLDPLSKFPSPASLPPLPQTLEESGIAVSGRGTKYNEKREEASQHWC